MKFNITLRLSWMIVLLLFSSTAQAQSINKVNPARINTNNRAVIDTSHVISLLEQINKSSEIGFDSTIAVLSKALAYAEQLNFSQGKLSALEKLGDYYFQKGFSFQSSDYYMRGLAVAEAQNIVPFQLIFTKKIGDSYLEEDFAKSIYFYGKNLELNRLSNNQEKYLLALNDIGIVNLLHSKFDVAISYFNRCLKENNNLNSVKIASAATTNIGVVYSRQNKHELALNQFLKALPIARVDGYGDTVPFIKDQMATVYLKLNKSDRALRLATEALAELPDKYDLLKTDIYKTLSDAYLNVGDDKKALANYKVFASRKLREDSLKNKQIANLLNLTFENEEQLQSLNKLNLEVQEKEYRNTLVTIAAVFLLVIALLTAYFYKVQRDKSGLIKKQNVAIQELNSNLEQKVVERTFNLEKANEELKTKNQEIIKALVEGQTLERRRVGTELHDNLGSSLSAIKWQLEAIGGKNLDPQEKKIYNGVIDMMKNAYSEVRLISHNMLPDAFEKLGLIGALKKLIDDINVSGKIQFQLLTEQFDTPISSKIEIELYGVCLELINNILKHSKAKNALVKFSNNDNTLQLLVSDDGIGLDDTMTSNGQGLRNIKNRITEIKGKLTTNRVQGSTVFIIEVPTSQTSNSHTQSVNRD